MNKTFTIIVATVAVVSLAVANIETPPAGYIEVTSSALACNPFTPFGGGTGTLADLDGTNFTGSVRIIDQRGYVAEELTYNKETAHWTEGDTENLDGTGLGRGAGFQTYSSSTPGTLVIAGNLSSNDVTVTSSDYTCVGYNLLGNVSAVAKPLSSFTFTNFDGARDYVLIDGVKYCWNKSKGWYNKATGVSADPTLQSGQGFAVYFAKAAKSITLPGSY